MVDGTEQTVPAPAHPARRSWRVLSAIAIAGAVVVSVGAFFFLAPSGSAHPRSARVAVTTTSTTVNVNKMHGNPTRPIPPPMAAMGCYQLHDGDPLPPMIVWAQPDTVFCPPRAMGPPSTGPPLPDTVPPPGPGPTVTP